MKNGDLSNVGGTVIYVHLDVLLTPKTGLNILDKTKIALRQAELDKYDINSNRVHFLNTLVRKTDYSVTLITDNTLLFKDYIRRPILPVALKLIHKEDTFKCLDRAQAFDYLLMDDTSHWYAFLTERNKTVNDFIIYSGVHK